LLPALLKLDRNRRQPTHRNLEHFLNLVRLSFLSMSTYTLRTLKPTFCATYSAAATDMALDLIRSVFPPFIDLPPSNSPNTCEYPDLQAVSKAVMQLPLTLGGLSLRLPESIADIAYAASAADCLPIIKYAAVRLCIRFEHRLIPELMTARASIEHTLPEINAAFWAKVEDPEDEDYQDEPLQHTLTAALNATSITTISNSLKPWPFYYHAFEARVNKAQDHVSWTLNPKTRFFYGLSMLPDAEFSRTIALATFYPVLLPRVCDCGQYVDPAAHHYLHCHFNYYGDLHNLVRDSLAHRLRSFMIDGASALLVAVEQPFRSFFALRPSTPSDAPEGFADIVISMPSDLQQIPIACDLVSCIHRRTLSSSAAFTAASRFKRKKYARYIFPANCFYPLPFGRTNVLSEDVLSFCSRIGNFFPNNMRVADKLRATISRSIYSGVARMLNFALRRLQLSTTRACAIAAIPHSSLLSPLVLDSSTRVSKRRARWESFSNSSLVANLAAALANPSQAVSAAELSGSAVSSGFRARAR
jgi:hypothetical protein